MSLQACYCGIFTIYYYVFFTLSTQESYSLKQRYFSSSSRWELHEQYQATRSIIPSASQLLLDLYQSVATMECCQVDKGWLIYSHIWKLFEDVTVWCNKTIQLLVIYFTNISPTQWIVLHIKTLILYVVLQHMCTYTHTYTQFLLGKPRYYTSWSVIYIIECMQLHCHLNLRVTPIFQCTNT